MVGNHVTHPTFNIRQSRKDAKNRRAAKIRLSTFAPLRLCSQSVILYNNVTTYFIDGSLFLLPLAQLTSVSRNAWQP